MASAALPLISIEHNRLNFGKHSLPLSRATSFWVRNKKEPEFEIDVHSRNGDYQATFRLMFEDVRTLHSAIRNFLERTKLNPSGIFCVRQVKPIIASKAAVEFTFLDPSDLDFFRYHAAPLFPGYQFEETSRGGVPSMRMTSEKPEVPADQLTRIKSIFGQIKKGFGEHCIKGALIALRDQRFPEEDYPKGGAVSDKSWADEHCREFRVTKESIVRIMDCEDGLRGEREVGGMAGVDEWLEHPEAPVGDVTQSR